jgi:hypothetical protein
MPALLHSILIILARFWRRLSSGAYIFFSRGREALLRRAEARTELEEWAVKQKQWDLANQQANDIVDLVRKVESIKDPQLRQKAKAAILARGQILLPQDEPAE